ncbi:S9 family peptidase [Gracilimonas sp.]|uniref:S9 family peptidase n=1 Tax=Gracilimonas sp. TaxID=1974203 RepID=UPI0028712653|nr:prolyl oligopeptidase family serine peptidase [Gracilimonas sp.]
MNKVTTTILSFSMLMILFIGTADMTKAQNPTDLREQYLTPPDEIAEEVLAPRHENVILYNLDPSREYFLNTTQDRALSPLSAFAKNYYNLGGLQFNPDANRSRYFTTTSTSGLELIDARTGETVLIDTPDDALISSTEWSPDGSKVAYFAHFNDATHIYVANLDNGNSKKLTRRPVLATLNTSFEWSGNGEFIFTVLVPENRGAEPQKPATPTALQVKMTTDKENRLRTYQDLLGGKFEAELLQYHVTGQLARINVDNRRVRQIGEPSMIRDIEVAPNGQHIIVETLSVPFSYIVPVYSFGWTEEVWDLDGNMLVELRNSEIRKGVPGYDEVENYGRRDIKWRPDGEGLSLLAKTGEGMEPTRDNSDNQDDADDTDDSDDTEEGSSEDEEEKKMDRVIQWLPPFGEDDMNTVYETEKEMESVSYTANSDLLVIEESGQGSEHIYAVYLDNPEETFTIVDHDNDDFYDDPGNLRYVQGEMGGSIVQLSTDQNHVFLDGTQYYENPEDNAPRPFLDKVEIRTGEKERIFQSSEMVYENVLAVLDDEINDIVISRESPEMHPDSWLVNLESGDETKLTSNVDYNAAVTQAQRERFKVKRADGFEFWVEVTLPADWDGTPLPGIIWHYPSEYDDQEDYNEGLRYHNKNDFPGVYTRSPDILVKRGYAVIDADWPIAAERGGPNDGFVWSIVQNSTVVIDSAAKRGYIDRDRMAIGGHSYGAFGTANAMIHTSFFKAGIAGDGNYNRTLTPLGFQREPRDLWRGLERYVQMTPIFWADRLDGALLMYHGAADQNVGTWPTHSRRMFHALNGIGKTAAMYMYPYEAHGPAAEETLLDLWTRWVNWLDHYVKDAGDHIPEAELGDD